MMLRFKRCHIYCFHKKACKITTFFSYTQIFEQKNAFYTKKQPPNHLMAAFFLFKLTQCMRSSLVGSPMAQAPRNLINLMQRIWFNCHLSAYRLERYLCDESYKCSGTHPRYVNYLAYKIKRRSRGGNWLRSTSSNAVSKIRFDKISRRRRRN